MSSNAPGQLLGFSIQFPRALFHLLRSGPGDRVSIEMLGDVSTTYYDGSVLTEEDKSSVTGNPVTDRSSDLWKTFFNWVQNILSGAFQLEHTQFLLYTNKIGRTGLVNLFQDVKTEEAAVAAIARTKEELKDIDDTHEIWRYFNYVVNEHYDLFTKIIQRFEFQVGEGASFDDVRLELRKKLLPEFHIEFLLDNLNGWLHKTVSENIARKENQVISFENFESQFTIMFDRVRRRELIDFTLQEVVCKTEFEKQMKEHPCYVKQLMAIEVDDDELMEAVSDFIKAKVNRDRWIENELIDEMVAAEFESKLTRFWKTAKSKIDITNKSSEETEKGKLLYYECKLRQETIRDMAPPPSTVSGTYHWLANTPLIGWHPGWENDFK
jgi:hypothetical protein